MKTCPKQKTEVKEIPQELMKRIEAFEQNNNSEKLTQVVEKMKQIKKSYEDHIKTLQESYESKIQFYVNELQIKDKIISEQDKKIKEIISLKKDLSSLDSKMSVLEKQATPRTITPKKIKYINTLASKKNKTPKVKIGWRM